MLGATMLIIPAVGCKADPPGRLDASCMTAAKRDIFVPNKAKKRHLPPAGFGEPEMYSD